MKLKGVVKEHFINQSKKGQDLHVYTVDLAREEGFNDEAPFSQEPTGRLNFGMYPPKNNILNKLIEVELNQRGQWWNPDSKTLKILGDGPASSGSGAAPAKRGAAKSTTPYDERQASIIVQSASRTATEILSLALEQEAVNLGAAKAKRLGNLMEAHSEITLALYERAADPLKYVKGQLAKDQDDGDEASAPEAEDAGLR